MLKTSYRKEESYFPCILSGWDNTPRYKNKGFLIHGSIPSLLFNQFKILNSFLSKKQKAEFIFIKAWNEWAEGNILEPYSFESDYDFPLEILNKIKNNE